MPIPASTASMAMSIVNGLLRLTGRVDRIMAEQTALRSELAFASKPLLKPPLAGVMKQKLETLCAKTQGQMPDPLLDQRADIVALVAKANPGEPEMLKYLEMFLPDEVQYRLDDPDGDLVPKLQEKRSVWNLDDSDVMRIAYYLQPGDDLRKSSAPWQIAMAVVDVLADLAIENQSLILHDNRARPLLLAILQRFANADLTDAGTPQLFLRVVLKTTVNGALDAKDALASDKAWVDSVLGALADTRDAEGEDFVVGLINGNSYPVLIGNLLEEGAEAVSVSAKANAKHFERIASDVLNHAATIMKQQDDFKGFINDHWGELLQAGLKGLHANGEAILAGQSPLLRGTLLSAIDVLAETPDRNLLSSETLTATLEAAIGAIAVKPELLDGVSDKELIQQLLGSTANLVANKGIQKALSSAGVELVIQDTLGYLAQQPELLVRQPGFAQDVVGSLLASLAQGGSMRLETVAIAGVQSLFNEIAANPDLVDTQYPQVVSTIADTLGVALADLRLTRDEARELLVSLAETVADNPALVVGDNTGLPAKVLGEVLDVLIDNRGKSLSSLSIREVSLQVLDVVVADSSLLEGSPELVKQSVAAVLDEISSALQEQGAEVSLQYEHLVLTALNSVLVSVAANPSLLNVKAKYAKSIGQLAGVLANALSDGKLNNSEVEKILMRAAEIIAANAQVLANEQNEIVAKVVNAILAKLSVGGSIALRGDALVELLVGTIKVLAANMKLIQKVDESVEQLVKRIQVVIAAGLERARQKLGQVLEQADLPLVVVELLRRWIFDKVPSIDINDDQFRNAFDAIIADVVGQPA
ncbi:hypothetical protein [Kaarinaea lacus]